MYVIHSSNTKKCLLCVPLGRMQSDQKHVYVCYLWSKLTAGEISEGSSLLEFENSLVLNNVGVA